MITVMNASAMTLRSGIENAIPADLAIMKVAVADPGPQITRAAGPRNSAATFREYDASALEAIARPSKSRRCSTQPNEEVQSLRLGDAGVNRSSTRRGDRPRSGRHAGYGRDRAVP